MNTIEQAEDVVTRLMRPEILAYPALIHKAVMIASNKAGKRYSLKAGLGQALIDYVEMNQEVLN